MVIVLVLAALRSVTPAQAEISGYALVQDDASLIIRGKVIRLFGTFIPDNDQQCRTRIRPARCGITRAAEALDFKIQSLVRCTVISVNPDRSINAICYEGSTPFTSGEDLGAFLIEEGLAVGTPDAPFEYHALERIARANGRGLWGFQVDSIRRRP
ncbi:MAG: nuclease-like protein [Hyphomicrobiales bacterium]|nr:nuclease-like protein [Hyphomicrobiales bacterium]